MAISIQQALDGFSTFASQDVIATMPNGMTKFLALMAVGAMKANPWAILKPYEPVLKSMGVISQDGDTVDVDILRKSMDEAFGQMPNFSWMGFNFTIDDANRLVQRMGG